MRTVLISSKTGEYGGPVGTTIESMNRLNGAHSAPYASA